ncbi:hypothetical protein ADK70_22570 [Streptomyces rimosus subsp. pseudoverticillatus]|nr:hypothetical protein ADK70_22570 [Streptomyces rimosus subsp. pseudoverticillatus]
MLVAAPLAVAASPAAAADGPQAPVADKSKVYSSDADIEKAMEQWAPVAPVESVMGYPKGIDQDEAGNIKPLQLADLENKHKYDAETALKDAKTAASNYAQNNNTPKFVGEAAKQLADSTITKPEVAQNTNDDKIDMWPGNVPNAKEYCEGRYTKGGDQNTAKANPCVFAGKLDETQGSKYPKLGTGGGVAGGAKKTFTISGQVTDENSSSEGWSVGGKFTPKATLSPTGDEGGPGGEVGGELGFTYSYSSTSLNRVTATQEEKVEMDFTDSTKKGSLQGRRDGAYYVGYIFVDYQESAGPANGNGSKEHIKAIPARVYVQSPKSSTPVTYFKLQEG